MHPSVRTSEGDILVDGGNAHFLDTRRREAALREKGIHFAGVGVSGVLSSQDAQIARAGLDGLK